MKPKSRWGGAVAVGLLGTCACAHTQSPQTQSPHPQSPVPTYRAQIVGTYPHDPGAFTEGLLFQDGALFESTGLEGQSELRKVDLASGRVLKRAALPANVFGEGLTSFRGLLIQLTWTSHVGYVYDQASFARLRTFTYPNEGWGLTQDGTSLIQSDGSNTLSFLNPSTFKLERTLKITADGQPVDNLNELEYIGGALLANVWLTQRIARIDLKSGKVTAWYDLSDLARRVPQNDSNDVLNGIAYDSATGRLFVTGKRWPTLFEVKLPGL